MDACGKPRVGNYDTKSHQAKQSSCEKVNVTDIISYEQIHGTLTFVQNKVAVASSANNIPSTFSAAEGMKFVTASQSTEHWMTLTAALVDCNDTVLLLLLL